MSQLANYNVWEPVFAKACSGLALWRLDYHGVGEWLLHSHIPILSSGDHWNFVKRGGVDVLSKWAKLVRSSPYESGAERQLGIRISGSYEKRLSHLRDSLIMIGWEQRCTTEGGIGTSFVSSTEITLYAELGNHGGLDIWGRCTERFVGGNNFSIASDCESEEEIVSAVENAGYSSDFVNLKQLQDLLRSTRTEL